VYYKKGETEKAAPFITNALKTGSKNPTLLCRAGAIYAKLGDKVKAKALFQDALKAGPAIDPVLKKESTALLSSL
jgi:tetratricopeptide (TPR) repeat protein